MHKERLRGSAALVVLLLTYRGHGLGFRRDDGSLLHSHGLLHGEEASALVIAKIQAYFVNMPSSVARASCMETQLAGLRGDLLRRGIELSFARYNATTFTKCQDVPGCMAERPECFPAGEVGEIMHPQEQDRVAVLRGVIGNWCSHLLLLDEIRSSAEEYDYFFVFEDDIIIDSDAFASSIVKLVEASQHHWALVAFDTFHVSHPDMSPVFLAPEEDRARGSLPLYSISHAWGYWGAHAWLIDAARVQALSEFVLNIPTIPLDWVPKKQHPLHLGMMAYNTGTIFQRKHIDTRSRKLTDACLEQTESDISPHAARPNQLAALPEGAPPPRRAPPSRVVVLGMYRSGARLLRRLVNESLAAPHGLELCGGRAGADQCGGDWPHVHPRRLAEAGFLSGDARQTLAIAVVRHPFSLVRSLAAGIPGLTCGNFSLRAACECSEQPGESATIPCAMCGSLAKAGPCWENMIASWNSYVAGYLSLENRYEKFVFLRYEDIIEQPMSVLQQLARELSLPLLTNEALGNAWKKERAERGGTKYEMALDKLKRPNYNGNFQPDELDDMCHRIDKHLLFKFGYSGCQDRHKDEVYDNITVTKV